MQSNSFVESYIVQKNIQWTIPIQNRPCDGYLDFYVFVCVCVSFDSRRRRRLILNRWFGWYLIAMITNLCSFHYIAIQIQRAYFFPSTEEATCINFQRKKNGKWFYNERWNRSIDNAQKKTKMNVFFPQFPIIVHNVVDAMRELVKKFASFVFLSFSPIQFQMEMNAANNCRALLFQLNIYVYFQNAHYSSNWTVSWTLVL